MYYYTRDGQSEHLGICQQEHNCPTDGLQPIIKSADIFMGPSLADAAPSTMEEEEETFLKKNLTQIFFTFYNCSLRVGYVNYVHVAQKLSGKKIFVVQGIDI